MAAKLKCTLLYIESFRTRDNHTFTIDHDAIICWHGQGFLAASCLHLLFQKKGHAYISCGLLDYFSECRFSDKGHTGKPWRHQYHEHEPCDFAAIDEFLSSCRKPRTRALRQGAVVCGCYRENASWRSECWTLIGRWTSWSRSDTGHEVLVAVPKSTYKSHSVINIDKF